jgi:hypothetical protein
LIVNLTDPNGYDPDELLQKKAIVSNNLMMIPWYSPSASSNWSRKLWKLNLLTYSPFFSSEKSVTCSFPSESPPEPGMVGGPVSKELGVGRPFSPHGMIRGEHSLIL